jgi:hypothetical protein
MTYGALKVEGRLFNPALVWNLWRRVGETTDYFQKSANHQTVAKK